MPATLRSHTLRSHPRLGRRPRRHGATALALAVWTVAACTVAESPPEPRPRELGEVATDVATALRDRDFAALAAEVHPAKGVRFSPYPYVDPATHVTLAADELRAPGAAALARPWGHHDGSGEPIRMVLGEYVDRFVYDAPYLEEATVGTDELQPMGNARDNLREVYPGARVVEYYVPGRDPRYGGMDWRSLRLVFERGPGERWWLVGIVHGEWTI